MVRGFALIALVAPWLVPGTARADDPLAQARKAVAESDYVSARPALIAALEAGGHGPEDVVEIYRLTGIVDAALGDPRAATEAFTRLITLSPKAALPDGTSPKIKRPFDAAARYVASHAELQVKVETAGRPPTITLVVVNDPLHMVATARAAFTIDGGAERTRQARVSDAERASGGAGRTDIPLPAGRRIDARIAALDGHGNRLVEIGSKDVPIVILGEPPAPEIAPAPAPRRVEVVVHASPRPVYLRWWPYAAVGVGLLGATGYFAWTARADADELDRINADSVHHTFAEAKQVEDRARRDVLFTNIGLGVTGAFALAAGALYLARPRDHVETRVAAVPLAGGGALVVGGTF